MEFYEKVILNNDITDAEHIKLAMKGNYLNKSISELNQHLMNLLVNLEKMRKINYNPIDSLLVFAITFKIFSFKKIKIIYHSLMTLYNFYCNKNKAIASAVLMCISLMHE